MTILPVHRPPCGCCRVPHGHSPDPLARASQGCPMRGLLGSHSLPAHHPLISSSPSFQRHSAFPSPRRDLPYKGRHMSLTDSDLFSQMPPESTGSTSFCFPLSQRSSRQARPVSASKCPHGQHPAQEMEQAISQQCLPSPLTRATTSCLPPPWTPLPPVNLYTRGPSSVSVSEIRHVTTQR